MARGCIVIADITGYTDYLSESELEHARDALANLLDVLLDHTRSPLVVSRTEGDAIISYAVEGTFLTGQTIVEIIESTYVGFRKALDFMVLNTTCDCNACRNIPRLDLKFLVHDGEFVTQQLAGHLELVGSDVNLIHRLTKNRISDATAVRAYTAYTEAAVQALSMTPFFESMPQHEEQVEGFGTVQLRIQDMADVWARDKDAQREVVTEDRALGRVDEELPVGQIEAWEYVTHPEFRAVFFDSSTSAVDLAAGGRLGRGAVYHCVHGRTHDRNVIVDWQPFDQYTFDTFSGVPGARNVVTIRLQGDGPRTVLTVLCSRSHGRWLASVVNDFLTRRLFSRMMRAQIAKLRQAIESDQRQRAPVIPSPVATAGEPASHD
jgi:hypothetical protein